MVGKVKGVVQEIWGSAPKMRPQIKVLSKRITFSTIQVEQVQSRKKNESVQKKFETRLSRITQNLPLKCMKYI